MKGWDETHWHAAKHLLCYLKGTRGDTILYSPSHYTGPEFLALKIYSDADWAGDKADRKSVSGYLGVLAGGPIFWSSKKQTCVATSSCEAELIALSRATEQALYMHCFFQPLTNSTQIFTVCQSAMAVVSREKQSYQPKLKHISIRQLHVADEVAKGVVYLTFCPTAIMLADPLTKALPEPMLKLALGLNYLPPNLP